MTSKYYTDAAANKYCNDVNCYDSTKAMDTCSWYISDVKSCPSGYKPDTSYASDGLAQGADSNFCDPNKKMRYCLKDPTWEGWDPLLAEYNKNPDKVSKTTITAMEKCCSRPGSLDASGRIKCGSLLESNNKTICADIMIDYCLLDEKNLLTPQCKSYINKDTTSSLKDKLRAICPSKTKDTNWNDVCSCYYGYNYYDGLAQKIEAVWEGPTGFISRIPECLDPKCAASQYRDTGVTATCPAVSFNKCIQNANFDIGSGDIGKLEFKQECKIGGDGKQIKLKGVNAPAAAGANPSGLFDTTPPSAGMPPKDNTILYIFVLFVILLFSGGGYWLFVESQSDGNIDKSANNQADGDSYYY